MPGSACSSRCSRAGPSPALAVGWPAARPAFDSLRVPIWSGGQAGISAGPRRVRHHGLEGLALVDADAWTPQRAPARCAPVIWSPARSTLRVGRGRSIPIQRRWRAQRRNVVFPGDPARNNGSRRTGHRRNAARFEGGSAKPSGTSRPMFCDSVGLAEAAPRRNVSPSAGSGPPICAGTAGRSASASRQVCADRQPSLRRS